mgnify:CR=1 FL=1
MKKYQIRVGGLYTAKVSGRHTTVRVDRIRPVVGITRGHGSTHYDVTNLSTGRKTTFRSAAKFRSEVHQVMVPGAPADANEVAKLVAEVREKRAANKLLDMNNKDVQLAQARVDSINEIFASVGDVRVFLTDEQEASEEADPTPAAMSAHTAEPATATAAPATTTSSDSPKTAPATEPVVRTYTGLTDQWSVATTTEEGEQSSDPTSAAAQTCPAQSTVEHIAPMLPAPSVVGLVANPFARVMSQQTAPVATGLTQQQQDILCTAKLIEQAYAQGERVMVIAAGAGTGKTFTLKQLEQVLCGNGQYTAFNAELCEESAKKFTKAAVNTTHSLAFRAVGKRFEHRLKSKRMRSHEVAYRLGIEDMHITLPECIAPRDEHDKLQVRRLKASWLAGQVLEAVTKFSMSADREIGPRHFKTISGLDEKGQYTNSNRVRDYLIQFARVAWADLSSETGTLPFKHDYYVKSWQLGEGKDRPIIAADYILLDEAQDTAPVMLDILMQQTHALIVLVGDDNQRIYEWRGAVNAMASFPRAPRRLLSKSFRFGQTVADVANTILATLDEPTDLVMEGLETIPSRVTNDHETVEPRCYLYRTNAAAIGKLLGGLETDPPKRGYLIGGPKAAKETLAFCKAAIDLQQGRGTDHQELGCFSTWEEVVAYSKEDEGADIKLMVKLITKFTAEKICAVLEGMPAEEHADFVAGTAHRSKGKEWTSVRLGEDFPTANKLSDKERRLLYVAGTRAQHELDLSVCPTFCGGYDKQGGGEDGESGGQRFIPGLRITFTVPMPTGEAIAAFRTALKTPKPVLATDTPIPAVGPPTPLSGPVNGNGSPATVPAATGPAPSKSAVVELVTSANGARVVTYAKLPSGEWGLWASAEIKEGEWVEVRTRTGATRRERVGKVVEVNPQAKKWLATKG